MLRLKHCAFFGAVAFCAAVLFSAFPVFADPPQNSPAPATTSTGANPAKPQADEPYTTVVLPLTYDPINRPVPVVSVRFNDTGPTYLFMVGTGTSLAIRIDPWAAHEIGLYKIGTFEDKKVNDTTLDVLNFASEIRLSLLNKQGEGDFRLRTKEVFLEDENSLLNKTRHGMGLAGIIGMKSFPGLTMQFDFVAKTLSICDSPNILPHSPSAIVLPLTRNKKASSVFIAHTKISLSGGTDQSAASVIDVPFLVDTGSIDTMLPDTLKTALKALSPTSALTFEANTAGTLSEAAYGFVPKITINRQEEKNIGAEWVKTKAEDDLLLGMNLLGRFRVTLDQKNAVLILEKAENHDALQTTPDGFTGIDTSERDGKFYVESVYPLARIAGTRPKRGDEIVSINGAPAQTLTLDGTKRLLIGKAGSEVKLVFNRNGLSQTAAVALLPMFKAAALRKPLPAAP